MGKSFSFAVAAFVLLLISPCVYSQVLVSQQRATLNIGDTYTVSGHNTEYNITVINITEHDARLELDGQTHTVKNGTNATEDYGRLSVELESLYYNLYSAARKVMLNIRTSCTPGCGDRDCGNSSNGCGDCGTCIEDRDVCDDGYCIGVLGEYELMKGESVRLKVNESYYVIYLDEVARSIAKIRINDAHFDLFKSDLDTMMIVKDELEIVVTSFTYDENESMQSLMSFDVKTKIEGCIPGCDCQNHTCVGGMCDDGCGGFCKGILGPDCENRECGISPNGCGTCGETGCPLHMRCGDGVCVLWECMPYIVIIIVLLGVIAAIAFIAVKRKPYRTPSAIAGVELNR